MNCGVPQGPVFSPMIFLILCFHLDHISIHCYADNADNNTLLYSSINTNNVK